MALGTPVLSTAYSGVLDFMDENCALLVPYQSTPVADPQDIYNRYNGQAWAEPDVAAAAAALTRLRNSSELGRLLGEAGRARVARQLSPQAWFETLPERVQAAALAAKSA
jgi:glycosyltransferase involved in cell wall biosynthesis